MKQKINRLLSLLLCCVMVLGMMPMTAFAAEITTGNATVTAPVGGQTPSFTAVSAEPDKYSVEFLRWIDVDAGQDIYQSFLTDPTSDYYNFKFEGAKKYKAVVRFTAVGDNTLSYDKTFTINGKETEWTGDKSKRTCMFIAESSATIPTIANQEVPVGTTVYIPWPEGAQLFQLYEVGNETVIKSATPTGSPEGMYTPAYATATSKTYYFQVSFADGWVKSNEFTIKWTNSAHTVTVTGGTANPSSATVGTEITLTPSAAPSGLVFDKWKVVSGGVTVTDNKFTMPDTAVEIKATYKVSIANQEVPVGTDVVIPWPEGATKFQLYEGSTMVSEGEKSGYPTGMHITAQSTAATKTYKFSVHFSDGWIDSNEFTVTWTNSAHTITVTGGTANPSSATVGTEITLTPSAAPSGLVFDKWKVVSGGVTVTDNKFTMPDTAVEIKATYKVSIANQEVPVGTDVVIPWPEGATKFQLYEGSTMVSEGEKSGYPTGMHITAQSTAATKTYKFSVHFSDGWIDSNEFTVTWKNATTYSATVADINISLPAGYGSSAIDALGEQRAIKITNTGTETLNIAVPTLSGTNADAFSIQSFGTSIVTVGSTNSNAYAVRPKTELEPGTYTATISCTDADGKLTVPVTATVTLTVGEHHFDTSTWEDNATHHWNPCTDTGCTAHGNEAMHNSDTVKNAKAATFDTDGYTGDKHCSFCDRQMETGTAIAAGKYIRESKATMTPASITADQCANDLVFASLETSKYTVALHSVYDMTDESLNTASGKYPTATKFVAGHQYRIVFKFTAVSPYAYDETHSTHCSTFTLNGAATNLAPFTSLAGSPNRMIELTAGASGITTYTVTINAGANMTLASGSANQSGLSGAMTDTVYTAADGYYFPTDYAVEAVNGISVTRNSYTQITVSGTPTANTAITLTQATAKTKEATPSAAFTADSENGGKLTGVDNTMKYSVNGGSNWLDIAGDNMAITSVTTANGVQVKKPATDANTKLDSDIQSIDVTKSATPTGVTGVACTTSANNDGKLQNVTAAMEYKKSDASNWTDCGGTEVTGLADGTYYVRVKATDTALASDYVEVTVAAYTATAHTHSWATAWSKNETHHWHECTGEGTCDVTENSGKNGYAAHTYDQETATADYKASDATCTAKATYYKSCICGAKGTETFASGEVNASNHTFGAWSDEVPATCKTTGTKGHKDCTGCNKHFDADGNEITDLTIPVDPANHTGTLGDWVKTDPDKHWKEYSCCHVKAEEATHTASDWITDTAATATTEGTKHKECTVCHRELEIGTIPATGYTITFDANDGTGIMADVTGVSGEYTLPANGFTAPAGKQFKAWSVGGVEKAAGDKITVTANTTVTAIWEPIPVTEYTITFNVNGGSGTIPSQTTSGQKLSSLPTATHSGSYSFAGWYTAASGGTQITTAHVFSANTTVYAHWTYTGGGGGSYYAPVVPDMPMLYRGCTGDAVKTLQDKLNALGYNSGNVDGIFGAKTYAAVTAFQKANSLGVDGIVGKLTWGKLYGISPAMPVETTTVVGRPMVSYGSRGDAVRKLQELLNALGYDCGSVDGIFGSKTKAAVLAFQKANGLGADGIVGPLTWAKLG